MLLHSANLPVLTGWGLEKTVILFVILFIYLQRYYFKLEMGSNNLGRYLSVFFFFECVDFYRLAILFAFYAESLFKFYKISIVSKISIL